MDQAQDPSEHAEVEGRRVILWLLLVLSLATILALTTLAAMAPAGARPRIWGALALNLCIPLVAIVIFRRLDRRQVRDTSAQVLDAAAKEAR